MGRDYGINNFNGPVKDIAYGGILRIQIRRSAPQEKGTENTEQEFQKKLW